MFVKLEMTNAKYLRWAIRVRWLGWNRVIGLGMQCWVSQPAVRLTVFGVEITGGRLVRRETVRANKGKDGWWEIDVPDRKYLNEAFIHALTNPEVEMGEAKGGGK